MEQQEEKLQLSEYLQLCIDIENGVIDPEAGNKAIKEFFSKLIVKDYMKHKEKIIILTTIMYRLEHLQDEFSLAGFLEMNRVMYGLLSYCVNLNNNLDTFGSLFGVYDAIREFGLYDYVLSFCKEDFELFSLMLRDAINISHIKTLSTTMAAFNDTDLEQWVSTLKDFKEQITPEVLKGLVEFNAANDSATQALLHNLAETALEGSEREMMNIINPALESTEELEDDRESEELSQVDWGNSEESTPENVEEEELVETESNTDVEA